MDPQLSLDSTCKNLTLYQAIKYNKLEEIKSLLDNGTDVNGSLCTTGQFAGYTALHVACMKNKGEVVEILISDYNANVNSVAEDGTHPIHLACFYENYDLEYGNFTGSKIILYLLKAGANADAEFGQEILLKHRIYGKWCPDFGEKISLLIYSVVADDPDLLQYFLKVSSPLKVKGLRNQTLLMYALQHDLHDVIPYLIDVIEDPAYLNLKDDDGIPTIHHMLHPKKYNQFRYHSRELGYSWIYKGCEMLNLICAGADKYALINDDPDTFLPNVAAYRSHCDLLQGLLPNYESMPYSKVLYNATLPIDDSVEKMVRLHPEDTPNIFTFLKHRIKIERQSTIEVALRDLVMRRTFGLQTNKEEIQLMERLIATDEDIKEIVNYFEGEFINGELKSKFVDVNGKKITILDFMKLIFDGKKLKLWASDKTICGWKLPVDRNCNFSNEYHWLIVLSYKRIKNGCERFKLLKILDEISILRKFIDLPYEIVLEFIEYLDNNELNEFINAFFC